MFHIANFAVNSVNHREGELHGTISDLIRSAVDDDVAIEYERGNTLYLGWYYNTVIYNTIIITLLYPLQENTHILVYTLLWLFIPLYQSSLIANF